MGKSELCVYLSKQLSTVTAKQCCINQCKAKLRADTLSTPGRKDDFWQLLVKVRLESRGDLSQKHLFKRKFICVPEVHNHQNIFEYIYPL